MMARIVIASAVAIVLVDTGCSGSCHGAKASATTETAASTIAPGAGPSFYKLEVSAAKQDCSACTWCVEPTVTMTLSGHVTWSSPSELSSAPVVRLTLSPLGAGLESDLLDPASPIDVPIVPATSNSADFSIVLTHVCASTDGCTIDYALTIARIEADPSGDVEVALAADATYASTIDGSVTVSMKPGPVAP